MAPRSCNVTGMTRTADQIKADMAALQDELASLTSEGMVVVRSGQSGVWLGKLEYKNGDEVKLADARRLWYWSGAASLSQLANEGVSKPADCKFPAAVASVTVLGVCEIIPATSACVLSIGKVKEWRQ